MKSIDYIILGHSNPDVDSIVSGYLLEKYLQRHGYNAQFIIPDEVIEEENLSSCRKYGLDPSYYQKALPKNDRQNYILVDHHEREIDGIIAGVIDHHPTSKSFSYPYYRNEKASSTASMIVKDKEAEFSKEEIRLSLLATMVDTISFHSSKTLDEDVSWVKKTAEKYHFSYDELYEDGLCLTNISGPVDFLSHGLKHYRFGDKKIAASSVLLLSPTEYEGMYPSIFSLLQNYVLDYQMQLFALIIHDMTTFCSEVYYITSNAIEKKEFDHLVSRGNEIIPELEKKIYIKR